MFIISVPWRLQIALSLATAPRFPSSNSLVRSNRLVANSRGEVSTLGRCIVIIVNRSVDNTVNFARRNIVEVLSRVSCNKVHCDRWIGVSQVSRSGCRNRADQNHNHSANSHERGVGESNSILLPVSPHLGSNFALTDRSPCRKEFRSWDG